MKLSDIQIRLRRVKRPALRLMADPVHACDHAQALRRGRQPGKLDEHWLEEPLCDVDFGGLRKLASALGMRTALDNDAEGCARASTAPAPASNQIGTESTMPPSKHSDCQPDRAARRP